MIACMEVCSKCHRPLKDGELVTGQSWSGEGGDHITCPTNPTRAITEEDLVERECR